MGLIRLVRILRLDVSPDSGVWSDLGVHYKVIDDLDPRGIVGKVIIVFRCNLLQLKCKLFLYLNLFSLKHLIDIHIPVSGIYSLMLFQ